MSAIASLVGAIISAALGALFDALRGKRQDEDRVAAHGRASVAEAAQETGEVIAEIADERSALPVALDDPDAIARRLRSRRSPVGGGGDGVESSGAADSGTA